MFGFFKRKPVPEPVVEKEELAFSATDTTMHRAYNLMRSMGFGIRNDEVGELILRRAADALGVYRDLDQQHGAKSNLEKPFEGTL